jgi:protein-L-isoaspartate(D-aspartate) O-methyltransferase
MQTSRIVLGVMVIVFAACGYARPALTPTVALLASPSPAISPATDPYAQSRKEMVVSQIQQRGVSASDVLEAMNAVPRHQFVPAEYLSQAYADHPLPIGYGQTISQPYIVALMTEKIQVKRGDKVLEIGTGSGYQAAVLAQLGAEVYSVEIIPELAQAADERLKKLGYVVAVKQSDGYLGWEEHAPYDAILVTAAPDHVPQPLVEQLKDGGRLVIPIGPQSGFQTLWQFTRQGDDLKAIDLGGVMFVPLMREK